MKAISFVLTLLISGVSFASEVHPQFIIENQILSVRFKQIANDRVHGIKDFYNDLKVPEEIINSSKSSKTLTLDENKFKISCENLENKIYECEIKTYFKSHAYRNVLLLPSNDLAITLKTKLAWEFLDMTLGQANICSHKFYADNFYFSICPNTVDLIIHPSKEQGFF